jgi:hypothetical protein
MEIYFLFAKQKKLLQAVQAPRMQWERAAAGMEAVGALSSVPRDSLKV